MKKYFILAIGIAVIIMSFILIKQSKPSTNVLETNSETTIIEPVVTIPQNQELCFVKNFNKDVTTVTLTVSGDKVVGRMDWVPFEKDSARGTLSGTLANGEMNLLYDYMIEGARQTEEKIMKIEDGKLLIKHGELLDPKYNGNLIYKDSSTAVYNEILEPCV